jgi:hypothetical protein
MEDLPRGQDDSHPSRVRKTYRVVGAISMWTLEMRRLTVTLPIITGILILSPFRMNGLIMILS